MSNRSTIIVACAVLAVAAISLVFTGLENLIIGWSCATPPTNSGLLSGIGFAITGNPVTLGALPAGCTPPATLIRILDAALVLTVVAVALIGWWAWMRWTQSDRYLRYQLLYRDGFAKRHEVKKHVSAKAALARAGSVRPALDSPTVADVGWKIGRSRDIDVYVSIEDSVLLTGPPRMGKGWKVIIGAIIDWCGPLITTSTRNDNLTATMRERQRLGEVTVFDPQGLSGIASSMKIAPSAGCEDPEVADARARQIVSGTSLGQSTSNQEWAGEATTLLSCLLHAAELSRQSTAALRTWGADAKLAKPAIDILRAEGAPGWGDTLSAAINGDPEILASKWMGVAAALRPLAIPRIFDALSPARGEAFDPDRFLAGRNTLYLIGTGQGAGAVGGFLGAILDDTVAAARRKALASPGSRLDPPLGLILDEIANMFAWPELPTILSDGGGIGISTTVVLQGLSQAKTAWSREEADTIWNSAIVRLLLGGGGDIAFLQDTSNLLGQRRVKSTSTSYSDQNTTYSEQRQLEAVMTADELRRLPVGMGLLTYRNRRGVLLDVHGWNTREDADQINEGKRATEAEQQIEFARLRDDANARKNAFRSGRDV